MQQAAIKTESLKTKTISFTFDSFLTGAVKQIRYVEYDSANAFSVNIDKVVIKEAFHASQLPYLLNTKCRQKETIDKLPSFPLLFSVCLSVSITALTLKISVHMQVF